MVGELLENLVESNKRLDNVHLRLAGISSLLGLALEQVTPLDRGAYIDGNIGVDIVTVFQTEESTILYGIWKKANSCYPDHFHGESLEYLIVDKGRFTVKTAFGFRVLSKGDCMSLPIGVGHSVTSLEDDSRLMAICIPPEPAYKIPEGTSD